MKRAYFWIIILLLALVSIHNKEYIEVSDRAMVHAVGIDKSEEGITVTLQVFKAQGPGGDTQIDPSKSNVFVISNTAETIDKAIAGCESQLGNYVFIGHNQIIVLGSGVSFERPKELLSYFIQRKDNYLGVSVVMAENTAKEVMQVQLTRGALASENFTEIIQMYRDNGETVYSDMLHFLNSIEGKDKSAVLPIVSVRKASTDYYNEENGGVAESENQQESSKASDESSQQESSSKPEESSSQQESSGQSAQGASQQGGEQSGGQKSESGQEQLLAISKAAVIRDGKIQGTLDEKEIVGVNWLTKRIDHTVVDVEINGRNVGASVKKRDIDLSVKKRENRLVFKADIKASVVTDESVMISFSKKDLERSIEKKIKSDCMTAAKKAYDEYDADILDVYNLIRFYYPQIYLDFSDNYDELKKFIDFEINVKCITE